MKEYIATDSNYYPSDDVEFPEAPAGDGWKLVFTNAVLVPSNSLELQPLIQLIWTWEREVPQ